MQKNTFNILTRTKKMCIIGLNYRILKEGETIYNAKQTKNENDLSAKAFSSVFQQIQGNTCF